MYKFLKSTSIKDAVLSYNNIQESSLNEYFDFNNDDEVFLNFKDKLLSYKDKKFLIVGDYDSDGIASTTIIKRLLDHLNISCNYYIPSRLKEGYGLNKQIVQMAIDNNFEVLLLVDNGINALEALNLALENNLKVMIIDHHEIDEMLEGITIIHNTNVSKKYQQLSAGGLCFVLSRIFYEDDISLVLGGLSQLSDMTPVLGFNRFLIKEMFKKLNEGNLLPFNLLNGKNSFSYDDLSFNIIPKLNAVSRMGANANFVVKLFLDDKDLNTLIEQINAINNERKVIAKDLYNLSLNILTNQKIELLVDTSFKEGLCGAIANRLTKELDKPCIILSKSDGMLKGSARANDDFNLFDVLKSYPQYESFGGHEGAIGLTIKEENFASFKEFVLSIEVPIKEDKEVYLLQVQELSLESLKELDDLKPFGEGLKEPLWAIQNYDYRKIIVGKKYPKYLIDNNLSAISFKESLVNKQGQYFIGSLKKDDYHKGALSFLIEDLA